jgi:hypothetical protein
MKGRQILTTFLSAVIMTFLAGCDTSKGDWIRAERDGTIDAYQLFLIKHPKSELALEAEKRIENLSWNAARNAGTVEALEKYLSKYPQGKLKADAENLIEALKLAALGVKIRHRGDGTIVVREGFQKGPSDNGIEEQAWNQATAKDAFQDYEMFLTDYPEGRFSSEARHRIDGLLASAEGLAKKVGSSRYNMLALNGDIEARLGDKWVKCPLWYQEDGLRLTMNGRAITPRLATLMCYKGFPFFPKQIAVDADRMLIDPSVIKIIRVDQGSLIPSLDSRVPIHVEISKAGNLVVQQWTQAIGVTWQFADAGMAFETDSALYTALSPGARLSFTKYGVIAEKMDIHTARSAHITSTGN